MSTMTTNEVVEHLDQYVIGQQEPKRAIALAYRERMLKAENTGAEWKYITPSNILMVGPSGSGKAQPLTAKIKVPGGWKFMRDIKLHDLVSTPDGQSAPVTGVFPQGIRDVYEVTFRDHRTVLADGEHLWKVFYQSGNKRKEFLKTTIELMELIGSNRVYVPLIKPIAGVEINMPVDPYLLGVLIGDGSYTEGRTPTVALPDNFIKEEVIRLLPSGVSLVKTADIEYSISGGINGKTNPFTSLLKEVGVYGKYAWEKSLPESYLEASYEQRLALLQGLMDTDGTVCKYSCPRYVTTSRELADQVTDLVRSMGWLAWVSTRPAGETFLKGKPGLKREAYTVNITSDQPSLLFRLPRKKDRCIDFGKGRKDLNLRVKSIKPVGKQATQCIMVDHPEHLYITDGYTVTHNTELARKLAEMTDAPFVKVEITDFTQVGYYGRDVKAILTDLVNDAIRIAPAIWAKENKPKLSKTSRDMLSLMLKDKTERETFSKVMNIPDDKLTLPVLEEALLAKNSLYRKINVSYRWYGDAIIAAATKKTRDAEPTEPEPNILEDSTAWSQWYIRNKLNTRGLGIRANDDMQHVRHAAMLLDAISAKDTKQEEALIASLGAPFNEARKKAVSGKGRGIARVITFLHKHKLGDDKDTSVEVLKALGPLVKTQLDNVIDISDALRTNSEPPADFIVKLVEERGIVFIDEFDKIFVDLRGSNVGNMGVVRDLMPYLDGVVADVPTKTERESRGLFGGRADNYMINTANILWIASGAFHLAKVADVPAEILGRLPVHVTLNQLKADDLEKVLIKPHGSLINAITTVLKAEGVDFVIEPTAIRAIAELAFEANTYGEDTGARRLKTVCRELFGDLLYTASNLPPDQRKVRFTEAQVAAAHDRIMANVTKRKEKKDPEVKEREDFKTMIDAIRGVKETAK